MKTLLKVVAVLVLILVGLFFFLPNTRDFAVFQNKVGELSKDIRSFKHRPASYYQWASELEGEWQQMRTKLVKQPYSESVVKQFDDLFEGLMKEIKADIEKAGGDVPQVLPQN